LAIPQHGVPAAGTGPVAGIVPFVEQGLLSVVHYTLIVTADRLIFCPWNPDTDEAMSDAEDEAMQESCTISETEDEIAHFHAKDWTCGPWERYRTMHPDAIAASAPGSIVIPLAGISWADIVCEQKTSTLDKLFIEENGSRHEFDLIYSQGPLLGRILSPLLTDRLQVADKKHRRGKLDRILSGQEYQ
jgi:hypothetical protein